MPDTPKPFYLTTPIYYVNARPHIGHAYTTIVGDVLARRHRLLGEDVFFLTGTDEHGQKIERSAAAAGIPPQQFADQVSASFETLWNRMGITHTDYIRTTEPRHKLGAQKLFTTLYENGFIYLASYTGSYCVSDEAFVDAPVGTPCPDCGRLLEEVTEENFFFKLSAFQLPLLNLIESGILLITPEAARNEVLSFIRGPIDSNNNLSSRPESAPLADGAERPAGEPATILRSAAGTPYLPGALRDLSISRSSFTWGIPVPPDIQAKEKTKQPHVIYVWLDALANYMTALGYGSDDPAAIAEFQHYWPADLHLVGKEITRFHCVYWPAFLLAAGLPTPKQITANGWLLFDNSKMSKSKGNIVRTETILDAFGTLCPPVPKLPQEATDQVPQGFSLGSHQGKKEEGALAPGVTQPTPHDRDLFAADILRYYLLREIPFGQDGSFSFEALITRYNAELANGYGNLVSRTFAMVQQFGNFVDPEPGFVEKLIELFAPNEEVTNARATLKGQLQESGKTFLELVKETEQLGKLEDLNLTRLCENTAGLIKFTDAVLSTTTPWKMQRNASAHGLVIDSSTSFAIAMESLQTILYHCSESIRIITALLHPILPYATSRVWAQLGLGDIELAARNGQLTNLQWGGLQPGTKLGPLAPIFPRAPKELAQIMTDMENPPSSNLNTSSLSALQNPTSTAPDAAPRTASLAEPTTTLPVAGSSALTTGPDPTLPTANAAHPAPWALDPGPSSPSPQITIDDFAKIDLRVAQITLAERIPKADKLLRLEVDLGPLGTRQILSGIAEFYTPEELTGRRIVVIVNLAPRKMRGLESHGMLLAASGTDHGKPHLATCGDDIALGSRLK